MKLEIDDSPPVKDWNIFEFHYKESREKDWVMAPDRKDAIYFIMSETGLSFGEVIKYCRIRKLSQEQEHTYKVLDDAGNELMSFYEVAAHSNCSVDFIAHTII